MYTENIMNVVSLKHNLLIDLLDECRLNKDLLIRCSDGQFLCNSFLFASIFPRLSRIVESPNVLGEDLMIFIPDICVKDLESVLNSIYNKQNITSKQNRNLLFLLNWEDENTKVPSNNIKDDLIETIKWETSNVYEGEDHTFEQYQPIGEHSENDEAADEKPVIIPLINIKSKGGKQKICTESDDDCKKALDQDTDTKERKKGLTYISKIPRFQYKELVCYTCEIKFKKADYLFEHVFFKHGPHPEMACPECDDIFHVPRALYLHRKTVHGGKLTCPDCGRQFIKERTHDYEAHLQSHIDQNIPCDLCDKVFKNTLNLQQHIKYTHEGIKPKFNRMTPQVIAAKCDNECKCDIAFKMVKEKVTHYKLVHMGYKECPKCNKIVQSLEQQYHNCAPLKKKEDKYKDKYVVCEDCGKEIHSKKIAYHTKKYHEVVECSCDKCGRKYNDTMSLRDHMRDCMKAEQCNLCGAMVSRINDHIRNVHTAEEDKRFVCNLCGKGFHQKKKLENHKMNNHLKLRPHRCRYGCDIGYNDTSNRNAHERKKHGGLFGETERTV